MIEKKIHYIWLSNEKMNAIAKRCIRSWKKYAPDYEVRVWRMNDFDFDAMPDWVNEALKLRKWAFVCDYLRLWILYREGGIYLDSDVLMLKSPDELLNNRYFSCIEYYSNLCPEPSVYVDEEGLPKDEYVPGFGLQAAVMGSEAGHPFLRECMKFYETHHFVLEDGSYFDKALAPGIQAGGAVKFGFRFRNEEQHLQEGMTIYHGDTVAAGTENITPGCAMIHMCNASWRDMSVLQRFKLNFSKMRRILSR